MRVKSSNKHTNHSHVNPTSNDTPVGVPHYRDPNTRVNKEYRKEFRQLLKDLSRVERKITLLESCCQEVQEDIDHLLAHATNKDFDVQSRQEELAGDIDTVSTHIQGIESVFKRVKKLYHNNSHNYAFAAKNSHFFDQTYFFGEFEMPDVMPCRDEQYYRELNHFSTRLSEVEKRLDKLFVKFRPDLLQSKVRNCIDLSETSSELSFVL